MRGYKGNDNLVDYNRSRAHTGHLVVADPAAAGLSDEGPRHRRFVRAPFPLRTGSSYKIHKTPLQARDPISHLANQFLSRVCLSPPPNIVTFLTPQSKERERVVEGKIKITERGQHG